MSRYANPGRTTRLFAATRIEQSPVPNRIIDAGSGTSENTGATVRPNSVPASSWLAQVFVKLSGVLQAAAIPRGSPKNLNSTVLESVVVTF